MGDVSLFDRVVGALFGGPSSGEPEAERQLVADMIEMIVDAVEPRVRLHARYKDKLEACVRTTIAHLRTLGKAVQQPLLLDACQLEPGSRASMRSSRPQMTCAPARVEAKSCVPSSTIRPMSASTPRMGCLV